MALNEGPSLDFATSHNLRSNAKVKSRNPRHSNRTDGESDATAISWLWERRIIVPSIEYRRALVVAGLVAAEVGDEPGLWEVYLARSSNAEPYHSVRVPYNASVRSYLTQKVLKFRRNLSNETIDS